MALPSDVFTILNKRVKLRTTNQQVATFTKVLDNSYMTVEAKVVKRTCWLQVGMLHDKRMNKR